MNRPVARPSEIYTLAPDARHMLLVFCPRCAYRTVVGTMRCGRVDRLAHETARRHDESECPFPMGLDFSAGNAHINGQEVTPMETTALARLQSVIDAGRAKAATAITYVQENVPQDALLAMASAQFDSNGDVALNGRHLTRHALGQACGRVGFPAGYAADVVGTDVGRRVIAGALNELWHADNRRVLTRTVAGRYHGIMSDSFRRIDCRPLVEAFARAAARIGAVPVDGVVTETRLAIKAVFPEPVLVAGRDAVALGVVLRNSDFGAGAFSISAYVMRLLCLNGMIGERLFQQRHLGGKLEDGDFFSERTYRLDAAAMTSATSDYVTGLLGADGRGRTVQLLEAAATAKLDPEAELSKLRLSKAENGLVRSALQSVDEGEMPLGPPSPYRMANALGWAAGQIEDADRKLDLERLAGEYLKAA